MTANQQESSREIETLAQCSTIFTVQKVEKEARRPCLTDFCVFTMPFSNTCRNSFILSFPG